MRSPLLRLVVVDDHVPFRVVAREVLERAGFQVVGEAGDGAAAVRTAEALTPDAVLLDVGLPDQDGFDVCERLATGGIPVVLMSSRDAREYADRLPGSSARGFLAKTALSGDAVRALLR